MKKIRDILRFICAVVLLPLYLPHLVLMLVCRSRWIAVKADLKCWHEKIYISLPLPFLLLYLLHNDRYFRSLFYYRIGPIWNLLIGWWRSGSETFLLPYSTRIGNGVLCLHAYATVLNAERIGNNFSCIQCTTIGKVGDKRPVIGDNVTLGANVCIVGGVTVGDNVVIGAGSVVVHDIPSNSVAVGNPARVVKSR